MPKKLIQKIAEEIVVEEPKRVIEKAAEQVGVKPIPAEQPEEEKISQEEIVKRKAKAKRILAAHRAELRDIKELPKQISGKPEFPQKEKKKEPPPLVAAKRPIGTRERLKRIIG